MLWRIAYGLQVRISGLIVKSLGVGSEVVKAMETRPNVKLVYVCKEWINVVTQRWRMHWSVLYRISELSDTL